MYHLRMWYSYIGRVASNSLWRWVAVLFQHTYWASLCVCKSWGRRTEWAINCVWLAFHTESNSWGVTGYSVEGINFSQIILFPFFLHPVLSLLRSLLAFLYCFRFLYVFLISTRLFPFILSFISCLPLFSFFSSSSYLFLSASFSTIVYLSFPFFVSCFVSLLSFCVRLQNFEKRLLTSSCLSVRMEQLDSNWTDIH